jgi:formate-dependent nitrite reductase membrane component NrfD
VKPLAETLAVDDGRDIDPSLGVLRGEGAALVVEVPDRAYPIKREVWGRPPSAPDGQPTYYGQPAIKEPVWNWSIPAYLFVGGAAGTSAALAAAAQALDPWTLRRLIRHARRVSAIGDGLSAALLVHDLGRPLRFLNMLRVFRPTSPMSVGSWVLTGCGAASTLAVLLGGRPGALGCGGDIATYVAGALGLPLAGYTGVLLANTAVPVWQGGGRALPALFLASGAASAGALLDLFPLRRRERAVAHRFAVFGGVAELALGVAYQRGVARPDRVARPLREGPSGALWKLSRLLTASSVALSILPRARRTRRVDAVADVLGLSGALSLRVAVFLAGKASARDPHATFQQQRRRLLDAERDASRSGSPAAQ